ncbi:L-serine ammonia-lyase, iron-sulfur-dependent, subunit alpha [bacterium]|nr:L-serine ammonia-lyase, iron-sulfur-dependent, subunit alpha [bacterium]
MTKEEYLAVLSRELVPALGCTEPIAVALAAAKARQILGREPEWAEITCSGNIIKNVKGVTVPRTGGLKGIEAAAIAGIVAGNPAMGLQVLESVRESDYPRIRELLASRMCRARLARGVENLFVAALVGAGEESAEVRISGSHANIVYEALNGQLLSPAGEPREKAGGTPAAHGKTIDGKPDGTMSVQGILEFARTVPFAELRPILSDQIIMNAAIAEEGLRKGYGASVGRMLLDSQGTGLRARAKAKAAAGSDARMSGSPLPVVINSGSGNQGITVSVPVMEFAKEAGADEETLYRALALANLVAIHQKSMIGKLSAFCGAVTAACGAGAGIEFLCGGGYAEIAKTIKNTLANVSGIVCDGAKPSCAAKIASAVDAAIMAHDLTASGYTFGAGEGLVEEDLEATMRNIGHLGRIGMKETDEARGDREPVAAALRDCH